MTKFEKIGLERQKNAVSKEDAARMFSLSCQICCKRGLRIDCGKCYIASTHEMVVAAFDILSQPLEKHKHT